MTLAKLEKELEKSEEEATRSSLKAELARKNVENYKQAQEIKMLRQLNKQLGNVQNKEKDVEVEVVYLSDSDD